MNQMIIRSKRDLTISKRINNFLRITFKDNGRNTHFLSEYQSHSILDDTCGVRSNGSLGQFRMRYAWAAIALGVEDDGVSKSEKLEKGSNFEKPEKAQGKR